MVLDEELYRAILARRSVRRYDQRPLDAATLSQIHQLVANVKPLVPQNQFQVIIGDKALAQDLVAAAGWFARLVAPSHILIPHIAGGKHTLTDLGYRMEQVAVRLTLLGIGSCYIGVLRKEESIRKRLSLPSDARISALLMCGWPATSVRGRAFDGLVRSAAGGSRRMPVAELFYTNSWDNPSDASAELELLIEAGRRAPSATNAQPWRFLWQDGRLSLFVVKDNPRYPRSYREEYALYDGGICMGNILLAIQALGMEGEWIIHEGTGQGIPDHPDHMRSVATLTIGM